MFSHKQVWSAIDALAQQKDMSVSRLARNAGLDPTTFNKSKRQGSDGRLRWSSTESLHKIMEVTGISLNQFVDLVHNKRPQFLNGLELDGWCSKLNIAFEYNGIQHYEYFPHFHRNGESDFKAQQARDRQKYKICHERGIALIIIPHQYTYQNKDELEDFIFNEVWAKS